MKLNAIQEHILVTDMNFGERVSTGGIILRGDNGKSEGVRPRWARVYAVGPNQTDVKVGEWILVEHGRWTRGIEFSENDDGNKIEIWRIDPNGILIVSDEAPNDTNFGEYSTPLSPTVSDFHF